MRLSGLATPVKTPSNESDNNLEKKLANLLEQAEIVTPWEIPHDVITMNSKVRLKDHATGEEMVLSLVFPKEVDVEKKSISVLAPIGLSILGRRVGDKVEGRIEVEELLYQPEAAGHFHL
jgi:regulator of nucleoside diphosphate kinase